MQHDEKARNALCKSLGLACHDTLQALLEEAVARGVLAGDETVRLSIEIGSGTGDTRQFHAVTPVKASPQSASQAA